MGMRNFPVIFIAFLLPHVYSAPQLISFNDGKLGVNFAGYHAAVGLGGLLGNGATGGLFAEAGTPHGQSAKAGLGGAVDANGGTAGGLYAGATAGGNVKAGAGLAGGVNGGTSAGTGFAAAQAGNQYSASTLFQSGGNAPLSNGPTRTNNLLTTKNIATNELIPPSGSYKLKIKSSGVINEANVRPNQEINGLIGASIDSNDSPQLIQKRIDIGSENVNKDNTPADHSVDQLTYRKEVNLQRNPTFFEDIFNIPIAALTAVRTFLTNTASNTSISLQKSGSVQAETDLKSPKHASLSSSSSSSDTQFSVKTPTASQLLDDILAIPINTLGAVNRFLDNNVPARRRVTVQSGDVPPVIRYPGRHARRRALKKEIIASQEQNNENLDKKEATN